MDKDLLLRCHVPTRYIEHRLIWRIRVGETNVAKTNGHNLLTVCSLMARQGRLPRLNIAMYHFVLLLKIPTLCEAFKMDNIRQLIFGFFFCLLMTLSLSACGKAQSTNPTPGEGASEAAKAIESSENLDEKKGKKEQQKVEVELEKALPKDAFTTVKWVDLMPKEDLDAILNPPSYVTDIEDGSSEDQVVGKLKNNNVPASDDRYQQALVSKRVVPEMDGRAIRIPGFVVPLEFDDDQTITQFFLVPFFGACIHVPPPPPNQIILVDYSKGLILEALYDPFWISGVLKTSLTENDMATSAYSLKLHYYEAYTDHL